MRSDSDVVISARHLTKAYRLFDHPGDRVKQFFSLGLKQYHKDFTAVQDVSFDICRGETVGIIGSNGAGKSTLLQLICGILKPTSGSVEVKGRVSALLELGAGFNPEFTGRENVFFQGMLMGLNRTQMAARFDEIAAFADIGEFMDQPVRTYSSGMFVRLAFSVMVHVDADILIVDEALAVGDMAFQARSYERMESMRQLGTTIVVVSHSLPIIRNFCKRAVWLVNGRMTMDGSSHQVCATYLEHHRVRREVVTHNVRSQTPNTPVKFTSVDCQPHHPTVGASLRICFQLKWSLDHTTKIRAGLGVLVFNGLGELVALFNTVRDNTFLAEDSTNVTLLVEKLAFPPGNYYLNCNLCDERALLAYDTWEYAASFEISQEFSDLGLPQWEGQIACAHHWSI